MDPQELNFDSLEPAFVSVRLAGKEYVLREASEDAACKFRNAGMRAARFTADGKLAGVEGAADAEPALVAACLSEKYDHKGETKERPVPLAAVMKWPARVVKALYEKVKELSPGLIEAETQEQSEKRFEELAGRLAGKASTEEERRQWLEWMAGVARRACGAAELSPEGDAPDPTEPSPNGTTATSASRAS